MVGTTRVLAIACVLAALAPGALRADDPGRAAQAFDALFGADLKRVRETPDARDDLDLAAQLLAAARKSADQPAFLAILCEKACDLSGGSPSGLATATQAMELLAAAVPEKAAACRERLLEALQKQFDAARGDEKKAAGEALLDGLVPAIEAQEKAGALVEAGALCRRAQTVARTAGSPRRDEIDARADAITMRVKAARRVADVKALLEKDPQNVAVREGLVRLYLVDLDDPAGAATHLAGCKDADLLKYVPAAAKPVGAALELACLELGEWYRGLAEKAPPYAKAAMYGRARAYLERFLETHPTKDLDQTRATVALEKVTESIARLTPPPPKPAPREKPAKPEPRTIPPGQWVELLRLVDPARDAVNGKWEWQGDSLALTGGEGVRALMLPVRVTGSYELQVRFARTAGYEGLVFPLAVGSAQTSLVLSGRAGAAHGLECINGKNCEDNETSVKPGVLQNNRVYSLHIRVTLEKDLAQVQAELDGSALLSWRGPVSALSAIDMWKLPLRNTIGLSSWASNVVYYSVRLKMLSGTDRSLRPAGEVVL